jgi:hypothetical protein
VGKYLFSDSCVEVLTIAIEKMYGFEHYRVRPLHLFLAILELRGLQDEMNVNNPAFLFKLGQILDKRFELFERGGYFFKDKELSKPPQKKRLGALHI